MWAPKQDLDKRPVPDRFPPFSPASCGAHMKELLEPRSRGNRAFLRTIVGPDGDPQHVQSSVVLQNVAMPCCRLTKAKEAVHIQHIWL